MRVRQRETGVGVIECRIRPSNRVMALRTERGWETRGNVIRNVPPKRRRAVPGRLMAPQAIRVRRREIIIVVDVAIGTGVHFARRSHLVRANERPAG